MFIEINWVKIVWLILENALHVLKILMVMLKYEMV